MLIGAYIVTIWRFRKENLRIALLKVIIVNKCLHMIDTIKHNPNYTVEKYIGDYISKLDPNILIII